MTKLNSLRIALVFAVVSIFIGLPSLQVSAQSYTTVVPTRKEVSYGKIDGDSIVKVGKLTIGPSVKVLKVEKKFALLREHTKVGWVPLAEIELEKVLAPLRDENGISETTLIGKKIIALDQYTRFVVGEKIVGVAKPETVLEIKRVSGSWFYVDLFDGAWVYDRDVVILTDDLARLTQRLEEAPTAQAYIDRAQALDNQYRYYYAAKDYQRALKLDPKNFEANFKLGGSKLNDGLIDEAIDYLTAAIDANPKFEHAYYQRGIAYRLSADKERCVADFEKCAEISRRWNAPMLHLGDYWISVKNYDKAIEALNRAIVMTPSDARAFAMRADVRKLKKEYQKAVNDYSAAIGIDREYGTAINRRALVYLEMDQFELAIEDFSKVLTKKPNNVDALTGRAAAFQKTSKYKKSHEDYSTALGLDPSDLDANNGIAWLLATCPDDTIRDAKQAIAYATTARQLTQSENANVLSTLAAAYAVDGQFEKAIDYLDKAIKIDPELHKNIRDKMYAAFENRKPYLDVKPMSLDSLNREPRQPHLPSV